MSLEAWKIISANVLRNFEIITLTPGMYRDTIESCANHGWIGGRIYDALDLSCARQAACDRLYTCNVCHRQQRAPDLAGRIGAPSSFLRPVLIFYVAAGLSCRSFGFSVPTSFSDRQPLQSRFKLR
jgi:hypothetical protein